MSLNTNTGSAPKRPKDRVVTQGVKLKRKELLIMGFIVGAVFAALVCGAVIPLILEYG